MKPFGSYMGLAMFGALALTSIPAISLAQTPTPPPAAKGPALAVALEAAQVAIATCAANGYKVGVSIVDSAGVLKVLLANDGAFKQAVESSTRKATTANTMKAATSAVAEQAKTDQALAAKIAADPTLFARAGGLPLRVGDQVIGAIGVGGAPGGEKDEVCAIAALDKIKGKLK